MEWTMTPLGEIIQFKNGKKRPVNEGVIPVYGGNGILGYAADSNYDRCVIIGRVGAYCGSVYYEENACWVSDNAIAALPKSGTDIVYAYYLLKGLNLNKRHIGTSQPLLTQEILNRIECRIPSLTEQKQIGAVLWAIDQKITLNNKINDNLLEQMQLLYQNLLDSCACFPIRLEEVSQKIAMGPFGSNIKVSTFVSEGVPIISGNHLRSVFLEEPSYNYITEEHAQKLKNSMFYPRDIVFTHAGNIGQVAMIPQGSDYPYYMISQRQFYMRCDETKVIPELVLFFFHSREGKGKLLANANSTGVPSIAQPSTHLKNIEMPMPNKADQDEWYKTIKPMVDMYVALCQENKRLISLRDSLLPRLMSGELNVSDIQF